MVTLFLSRFDYTSDRGKFMFAHSLTPLFVLRLASHCFRFQKERHKAQIYHKFLQFSSHATIYFHCFTLSFHNGLVSGYKTPFLFHVGLKFCSVYTRSLRCDYKGFTVCFQHPLRILCRAAQHPRCVRGS